MSDPITIHALVYWRALANLSVDELGRIASISGVAISRWERGEARAMTPGAIRVTIALSGVLMQKEVIREPLRLRHIREFRAFAGMDESEEDPHFASIA